MSRLPSTDPDVSEDICDWIDILFGHFSIATLAFLSAGHMNIFIVALRVNGCWKLYC